MTFKASIPPDCPGKILGVEGCLLVVTPKYSGSLARNSSTTINSSYFATKGCF